MKSNMNCWSNGAAMLGMAATLLVVNGCKEDAASGGSGGAALESQVQAAEQEVKDLAEELAEYRAKVEEGVDLEDNGDLSSVRAQVEQIEAVNNMLKQEFQEFKAKHPMPY